MSRYNYLDITRQCRLEYVIHHTSFIPGGFYSAEPCVCMEHYSNLNPSACGISEYGNLNIWTFVDLYILFIIMPLICGGKQGIVTKV